MNGETQRWKCLVAYDGTAFSGWQAQPDMGTNGGSITYAALLAPQNSLPTKTRRLETLLGSQMLPFVPSSQEPPLTPAPV